MAKIKRSEFKTFLNTGTIVAPVWSLIGDGVVAGKIAYNPKTAEETYIHEDSANISVESYAPNFPVEATAISGDAVFEFIDTLRKSRGTLADAETEIVNVWIYDDNAGGYYQAEKQAVSLQLDEFGGDGGAAAKINYTINFVGEPESGWFKPAATATFYPDPILATLATLSITGKTLTPVFSTGWYYYTCTTTNASNIVNATPANSGTLVLKNNGGTPFNSGDSVTWITGLNDVTIQNTVGAEVYVHHIFVTKS